MGAFKKGQGGGVGPYAGASMGKDPIRAPRLDTGKRSRWNDTEANSYAGAGALTRPAGRKGAMSPGENNQDN